MKAILTSLVRNRCINKSLKTLQPPSSEVFSGESNTACGTRIHTMQYELVTVLKNTLPMRCIVLFNNYLHLFFCMLPQRY